MKWLERTSHIDVAPQLLAPRTLYSEVEALERGAGAPARPGIYAWYFDAVPGGIVTCDCHSLGPWNLLYCGISPSRPPTNGRPPSRSHIRRRLQTHFRGNASGSTLRLTLGCLLQPEIGTVLQRVGKSGRLTFTNPGEQILDRWIRQHARVVWAEHLQPWLPEQELLGSGLPLPLNIDGNPREEYVARLKEARNAARRRAEELPQVYDNGGPRRASE